MRVVFSQEALAALEAIGDDIAQDSPRRAVTFIDELETAARAVGEMPEAHPLVPRYAGSGVRRRIHGAYLILYRIQPPEVVILLIVHGAQDYGPLLGLD